MGKSFKSSKPVAAVMLFWLTGLDCSHISLPYGGTDCISSGKSNNTPGLSEHEFHLNDTYEHKGPVTLNIKSL